MGGTVDRRYCGGSVLHSWLPALKSSFWLTRPPPSGSSKDGPRATLIRPMILVGTVSVILPTAWLAFLSGGGMAARPSATSLAACWQPRIPVLAGVAPLRPAGDLPPLPLYAPSSSFRRGRARP